ncbi:MAG TPA: hypothetical protein VMD09_16470 [Solirubrobacteraceae bacterium]|nr:hypothetical protein [Solirubrobacteraceae bacterium]
MLAIADWSTVSSLATGVGTLVLAIATFAAVRSSNRSARIAEEALQEQRSPIFTQSRLDDPRQKIMFVEGHWVSARGGHGVAEHDGAIYFAMSLRNVGAGIGVCQAWHVTPGQQSVATARDHAPEEEFRLQTRDLYIPAGDIGMWQGALRDRNDATYQALAQAIDDRETITIELLYTDQVGGQRTISRFGLVPYERQEENGETRTEWFVTINRHWYLDRTGPRSDEQIAQAVDVIVRERDAGEAQARAEAAELAEEERAAGAARAEAEAESEAEARRTNGAEDARDEQREPVAVVTRPNCE